MKDPLLLSARILLLLGGLYLIWNSALLWAFPPSHYPHEYIGVFLVGCYSLWHGIKCLPR